MLDVMFDLFSVTLTGVRNLLDLFMFSQNSKTLWAGFTDMD